MDRPVKQNVLEALEMLSSLADLTKQSLPQPPKVESVEKAADPVQFVTSTEAYAPALQNQKLVEALLALHNLSASSKKVSQEETVKTEKEVPTENLEAIFEASEIPVVEAQPKEPSYFRKSQGNFVPILRP